MIKGWKLDQKWVEYYEQKKEKRMAEILSLMQFENQMRMAEMQRQFNANQTEVIDK